MVNHVNQMNNTHPWVARGYAGFVHSYARWYAMLRGYPSDGIKWFEAVSH